MSRDRETSMLAGLTLNQREKAYKASLEMSDQAHGNEVLTAALRMAFLRSLELEGHERLAQEFAARIANVRKRTTRKLIADMLRADPDYETARRERRRG